MDKTICVHGSSNFYEISLIEFLLKEHFKVIWINYFKDFDGSFIEHENLHFVDIISRDYSCLFGLWKKIPEKFREIEILINTECAGTKDCHDTWDIGENLIRTLNVTEAVIPLLKNSKEDPKVININFMKDNHHITDVISDPLVHTLIDAYRNAIRKENIKFKEFAFDISSFKNLFFDISKCNNIKDLVIF